MKTVLRSFFLIVGVASFSTVLSAELLLIPASQETHDLELKDLGHGEWEARTTGTDQEDTVSTFAKPIIGVKDWSEVRYTREIGRCRPINPDIKRDTPAVPYLLGK